LKSYADELTYFDLAIFLYPQATIDVKYYISHFANSCHFKPRRELNYHFTNSGGNFTSIF
jgi:hypothetical protein